MVPPSFVPPAPIRELRELTRYRKTQVDVRVKEIQRLEKLLQDAGITLTSVASRTWSKSALAMVEALIDGERDPQVLADLSKSRLGPRRNSSPRPSRDDSPTIMAWLLVRSWITSFSWMTPSRSSPPK
jgi:hypothetical protein